MGDGDGESEAFMLVIFVVPRSAPDMASASVVIRTNLTVDHETSAKMAYSIAIMIIVIEKGV